MKYNVLLLLSITSFPLFAMEGYYQLPSQETIIQRLHHAQLNQFARQSKIAEACANSFYNPIALHTQVSSIVNKYKNTPTFWNYEDYKKGLYDTKQPSVSMVMTLLLQDHPRALIALEKNYDGAFLQ